MKTILSKSFLIASVAVLFAIACNNANNGTGNNDTAVGNSMGDSVSSRQEDKANGAAGDAATMNNNNNDDSSFVAKAMTSNAEELVLIQAGIEKGTSSQLKKDARMMLADHNKLKSKLESYAGSKHYPTSASDKGKSQDDLDKLNKNKVGTDWDKAWADHMESEHKDDINAFEKGERNVKDSSLHTLISNTLPVLHAHLSMAQELQKTFK
jgi:putative membrane protein